MLLLLLRPLHHHRTKDELLCPRSQAVSVWARAKNAAQAVLNMVEAEWYQAHNGRQLLFIFWQGAGERDDDDGRMKTSNYPAIRYCVGQWCEKKKYFLRVASYVTPHCPCHFCTRCRCCFLYNFLLSSFFIYLKHFITHPSATNVGSNTASNCLTLFKSNSFQFFVLLFIISFFACPSSSLCISLSED